MSHPRERLYIILVLCLLTISSAFDIWEDIQAGDGLAQILRDIVVVSMIAAILIYIYALEPLKTRRENTGLLTRAKSQADDLEKLSQVARKQLDGLGRYIEMQFDAWALTTAEKDVALMLLKGFSMKEIAELRNVSERTTRQQSITIYSKANVPGRAGLSAFFLEDLLLPSRQG